MPNRVRVLGILGSPRRGGNTELLLEEALKGAREEGADVELIRPSELQIAPCRECLSCYRDGNCVTNDEMQQIYPRLLEADIIILASPIFFYSVTAWLKALIDRTQALWARKYILRDPSLGEKGKRRIGFFISVGGTKGQKVFDGAVLTARYFFDVVNAEYAGELVFRNVDAKGDILAHPEALREAFEAGRRLVREFRKRTSPSPPNPTLL